MRSLLVFFIICFCTISCKKNKPFEPQFDVNTSLEEESKAMQLLVINEGNFTLANASITSRDLDANTTRQNVFFEANKKPIGDIAQSLTVQDYVGYLCVNNSNKIIKIALPSLKEIKTQEVPSPRYSLITSRGELWVTSLNKKVMYVLDTLTFEIQKEISVTGWLEKLVEAGDAVFVCNVDNKTIDVFDLTGTLTHSIPVGRQPQSIVKSNDLNLWVLCDGGYNPRDRQLATLHQIDPIAKTVNYTYTFKDIEASPSRLIAHPVDDKLYFLNRGIFSFSSKLPFSNPKEVYVKEGANFYGLGINLYNSELIVTDALNYSKNGIVTVLDDEGGFRYDFEAGVIPQAIVILK